MWCLETILRLNAATQLAEDHKEAAQMCGIRVLGNSSRRVPVVTEEADALYRFFRTGSADYVITPQSGE